GLDANEANVGLGGFDRDRHSGDQPTSSDRNDDGVKVLALLEQLERHGPLPRRHAWILERMHQYASLRRDFVRAVECFLTLATHQLDFAAVAFGRLDFRARRAFGHHGDALSADHARGPREGLRMVSGRDSNDATRFLLAA